MRSWLGTLIIIIALVTHSVWEQLAINIKVYVTISLRNVANSSRKNYQQCLYTFTVYSYCIIIIISITRER